MLRAALQLGLTSFGGPVAHLGYFERAYVRQRRWLSAESYAELVALCQILPGPTSSQVGFLVGLQRAGWAGALAAWIGFTLPSALILYACARLAARLQGPFATALLHGLKLVAVAVVAQAVWSMARRLCTDAATWLIALAAAAALLMVGGAAVQLAVLAAAAVAGVLFCRPEQAIAPRAQPAQPVAAWLTLGVFALLLLVLPLLAWRFPHSGVALAAVFYRSGALVFGGGHVVLPLLRDALVPNGWLSDDAFLAGYGLAQAVPGPLFTVSAYLGARSAIDSPAAGAAIAVAGIFLPGLLLAAGGVSLWSRLTHRRSVRTALSGVNAAVVGILAVALYDPIWTTSIRDAADVVIAGAALLLLWRVGAPPLLAVLLCAVASVLRVLL